MRLCAERYSRAAARFIPTRAVPHTSDAHQITVRLYRERESLTPLVIFDQTEQSDHMHQGD